MKYLLTFIGGAVSMFAAFVLSVNKARKRGDAWPLRYCGVSCSNGPECCECRQAEGHNGLHYSRDGIPFGTA